MSPSLRPPALPDRPVIRVVAPSGCLKGHLPAIETGLATLESAGCRVRWDPNRLEDEFRGYLAGEDTLRAQELCSALREPEVDGVWIARGGSGLNRILDPVLAFAARLPPRILVGFSDATSLLHGLGARCGWVTFHGPVVASFGRPELKVDVEACLAQLRGDVFHVERLPPATGAPLCGVLRGGNLSVLASLAGTGLLEASPGAIWMLEDVAEAPYRLDRLFWQLRMSGALAGAKALWWGDLGLNREDERRVRADLMADCALPSFLGAPVGHRGRLALLPLGLAVSLDPSGGRLWSDGPWVERAHG